VLTGNSYTKLLRHVTAALVESLIARLVLSVKKHPVNNIFLYISRVKYLFLIVIHFQISKYNFITIQRSIFDKFRVLKKNNQLIEFHRRIFKILFYNNNKLKYCYLSYSSIYSYISNLNFDNVPNLFYIFIY